MTFGLTPTGGDPVNDATRQWGYTPPSNGDKMRGQAHMRVN